MFNWFDLVQQAQTRAGLDALTSQFHLSGDQTRKAMAAFLPAFAMGLQHAAMTGDPARFVGSMMGGGSQNLWQAAARSFSPQAQQQGRTLLDQIFGSDQVSRRVAHQAADYAGISADTMQQMLPLMAGILAGSMSQWMTAQAQAVGGLAAPAGYRPGPEPLRPEPLRRQSLGRPLDRLDEGGAAGEGPVQSLRGHDGGLRSAAAAPPSPRGRHPPRPGAR
jgi:hypothetical protein